MQTDVSLADDPHAPQFAPPSGYGHRFEVKFKVLYLVPRFP